jgi:pimeloyl-ACP methyl ester carboxylesterase
MLQRVLGHAASQVDRAAHTAVVMRTSSASVRIHHEKMRILQRARALYDRPELYRLPSPLFPEPAPIAPRASYVRSLRGAAALDFLRAGPRLAAALRRASGSVIDIAWPSAYAPYCEEFAEHYLAHEQNRTAVARLFLHHDRPRPAVLLFHGYGCGHWALEERLWPIASLFESGLDIALPVLPFHALRGAARGLPIFPSRADPRVTIEGFAQAVHDARALIQHLRDRGAPAVGVIGMSLGSYTASLLATVVPDIAFVVPMIPLASLADFSRASRDLVGTAHERRLQHSAHEAAFRVVSPLARPARLDRDRILVLGAAHDQITPVSHARMLAEHFRAPLEIFPGGHLLQFGRAEAFRSVRRLLDRLGILSAPRRLSSPLRATSRP